MSNPVMDYASAPLPASGIPTNTITDGEKRDVKDLIFNGQNDVEVTPAHGHTFVDDEIEPTDEEYLTLRKVPAPMKWAAIAMCFIELAERASYYGCTKVWNNYMKNPLPIGGNGAGAVAPGAAGLNQVTGGLGIGSVSASAVTSSFNFLTYTIPIAGGIIADTKWGRFKTILVGTIVGFFAHVLLCAAVVPSVISTGNGFPPFLISLLILAFAAGLIKPSLGPLLCDQSPVKRPVIRTTKTGERVIVDPQATVSRYLNVFYMCINIGAFLALGTAYAARLVGFWCAFLIPGLVYLGMPIVMFFCYKHLYKAPPQGSVTLEALKVIKTVLSRGGIKAALKGGESFWQQAKPSYIEATTGSIDKSVIFWDDTFVDEIRQSIKACGVFFLIPIFNLSDGGIGISETAMSNAMVLNGIPSEIYSNANPLTIIIASPIFIFGIYPLCNKLGFAPKPTLKLMAGFLLASANMIIGAIVQWKIYQSSPCGYYASSCKAGVSTVNLAWQLPLYILPALGEILVNVTSYELAYTRAPARMKGLVYAICLFSQAISYAIQLAMSSVVADPYLIWPYVALAIATFITAFIFPTYFKELDQPMRDFADPDRQSGKQQPNYKAQTEAIEDGETRSN